MVLTWTLVLWNNLAGIGSYRIIELAGSENHGVGVSAYQTLTRLAVRHRPSRPPHLQPRPPPPRPTAAAALRANDPFPRRITNSLGHKDLHRHATRKAAHARIVPPSLSFPLPQL